LNIDNKSLLQTKNKDVDYLFFKASDDRLIPFKISGQGSPLLLIHGLGGELKNWDKVAAKLSKTHTVLRLDQRGHGKSVVFDNITIKRIVDDVIELTDYVFGKQKFTIAGHSMGGITLLNYISYVGCKKLNSVILMDTTPCIFSDKNWPYGLYYGKYTKDDYIKDLQLINKNFIAFYSYFVYRSATKYNPKRPPLTYDEFYGIAKAIDDKTKIKVADMANQFKRLASTPPKKLRQVMQTYWQATPDYDTRKVLPKINVPVLIIYAQPGSLFTPDLAFWMKSQIKKAPVTMAEITNSSHVIVPFKANQVIAKTSQFLLKYTI
jgi:pimeloyl-ACP methyl ester carboxylesterase